MFRMFRRRPGRAVAVLGAGPAGLLAAQAAHECGYSPIIFSRSSFSSSIVAKSELHGCQYLHAPVPSGLWAGDGALVDYTLEGTGDGYRTKVYGAGATVAVSPDEYGTGVPHWAWDLRKVYDKLWGAWLSRMRPMSLSPVAMRDLLMEHWAAILVSVPAPVLCQNPKHNFLRQSIWAMGQRTGGPTPPVSCPPFTVVCNGERDTGWYRKANVFGHTTVEWSGDRKPPINGVARVEKPISTNCDCFLDDMRVHRLGRFGQWKKGVLVHSAYNEVKAMMK